MRKPTFVKQVVWARFCALLLAPGAVLTLQGCTDLSETPTSAITPENFYKNEDEVLAGVAAVTATGLVVWTWE